MEYRKSIYAMVVLLVWFIFMNGCISHNEGINDILSGGEDIEVNALFSKIGVLLSEKKYTEALTELNNINKGQLTQENLAKTNSYYSWLYYQTRTPSETIEFIEKNTVNESGQMIKFFSYWSRRYSGDITKAINIADTLDFSDPAKDYTEMNSFGISEGEIHAMLAFCYYLRASSTDYELARQHLDRAKKLNLIENSFATSEIVNSLEDLLK